MPKHATKTSFKKGVSGNPEGGRKKKVSKIKAWELMEQAIIGKHTEKANDILSELAGKEFFDAFCKLLEYFKPKQGKYELTGKVSVTPITVVINGDAPAEIEKSDTKT